MKTITLNTEDIEVVDTSGNPIASFKVEEFAETGKLSIHLHSMNPDLKGAVLYPTGFVVNHPTLLGDQYGNETGHSRHLGGEATTEQSGGSE